DETVDRVVADRIQIEQVLLNLLRNGHESVEETDGDSPLIVSSHRLGDDEVKICIADRGTGISDEVMASLFTPFETAKVEGHGIGLSICRTIVEGHGGRIWVEDNPLGGAVFCFTLKLPSLDP
ncbi:MAG: multi-sensor signal transduction histidine kinase, partial [Alphaproteobacteria bacterium]|nr:multi-sensor signal transduction histidine kinase [Alphaproteobacteria bacterium]